jgi:UDP-galactopyranose mutase
MQHRWHSLVDLLVVGSGLTGATIARLATDAGHRVLVLERRHEIGGNIRDAVHASGIRYGLYGPHYFRTSSDKIWAFVNRFATFRPFSAEVKTVVAGRFEDWPVTTEYLCREFGPRWQMMVPIYQHAAIKTFEDACLAAMPAEVYKRFIRGYTAKQWGIDPDELDAGLAGRFAVREGQDRRLKQSVHQGVPTDGYAAFAERLLEGIETHCGVDYLRHTGDFRAPLTIFTGPIDEFFDFYLGPLGYRAQQRELIWYPKPFPTFPSIQTNYPDLAEPAIRAIEWRHMNPLGGYGTLITREYPYTPEDPDAFEYPCPTMADRAIYSKYRERAECEPNVILAGRLGRFKYYDMDQAIGAAMQCWQREIRPHLS